jgi:hypothetical protein
LGITYLPNEDVGKEMPEKLNWMDENIPLKTGLSFAQKPVKNPSLTENKIMEY